MSALTSPQTRSTGSSTAQAPKIPSEITICEVLSRLSLAAEGQARSHQNPHKCRVGKVDGQNITCGQRGNPVFTKSTPPQEDSIEKIAVFY
jgi:hypothetical protein